MTWSACPVCGGDETENLGQESKQQIGVYDIAECAQCGHRFLPEPPTNETLHAFYERLFGSDVRQEQGVRPGFRDVALSKSVLRCVGLRAKVLDIGCNFGESLRAYPATYELHGIELSPSAARAAAEHRRLHIRQGLFEEMDTTGESYDLVTALAVIEHVRDPVSFLRKVAEVVKPGGMFVLMTGDYDTWHARTRGPDWHLYHSTTHLHFFCDRSLTRALNEAGFEVEDRVWAGPTPLTSRLPPRAGRLLHCQTTSILFPQLLGRRRYGDLLYMWTRRIR